MAQKDLFVKNILIKIQEVFYTILAVEKEKIDNNIDQLTKIPNRKYLDKVESFYLKQESLTVIL
ncbi:hypothetical protein ACFLY2_03435 [Patescibacteria group bacterium]